MLKKQTAIVLLVLSALLIAAPLAAHAQITIPRLTGQASGAFGGTNNTVGGIILTILEWVLRLSGLIAVGFVIYGGFRYMTSGGSEEGAEAGKTILTNAVIGLAIIILAYVILTVVVNAINGNIG
jgi:hypothetical protein